AEPPSDFTLSTTLLSLSALRATATTCRPSFARRLTIASPMPLEPPVTIATRLSVIVCVRLQFPIGVRASARMCFLTDMRATARTPTVNLFRHRIRGCERFDRQAPIDFLEQ